MAVVCEQPTIADKLVPYVEGALAEPDRTEVLEHLRGCQSCAGEVRQLKASIIALRQAFSRVPAYRPATHVSSEDLERFACEPETLTAEALRRVKLHLAVCQDCEQEVTLLRDMEQELAEKVESVRAPEALPGALREAIAQQFGATSGPVEEDSRRPWLESLLALLAGFSPKPLLAAGGALAVLFVGLQFVHQVPESPGGAGSGAVATVARNERPLAPAAAPPRQVAATPAGPATPAFGSSDVALLPGRVDSQELPGFSRKLWEAKVSHAYRDGQIYVAAEDVDRARKALELVPREVAAVDLSLKKTKGEAFESDAGTPGAADEGAAGAAAPSRPSAEASRPVAPPPPESRPEARAEARPVGGAGPLERKAVTAKDGAGKAADAAAPALAARIPAKPAAAPRPAPPRPAAVAVKLAPAPAGTETVAVLEPTREKPPALANPRQQIARVPAQQQVAINPSTLRGGEEAVEQLPVRSQVDEQPRQEVEGYSGGDKAVPRDDKAGAQERKDASRPPAQLATRSTGAGAGPSFSNMGNVGTVNAPASAVSAAGAVRPPANRLDEAPPDSALLAHARRVATESVGESTVSVEKREDGSVVVTVRSGRPLNSQEMDALRKALRQQLSLADSDTVVIRQP